MKKSVLLLSLFIIYGCDQKAENTEANDQASSDTTSTKEEVASYKLEKLWETDTVMYTSESVLYDKERNQIYVSNINGNATEKDGNGFISALDTAGNLIHEYLFSGYLDAPKGMAISGDKLYIADINRLVEVDLTTKVSGNIWEIDTANFLNDVAAGPDGTIYFSDSGTNTIYALKDNQITVFLKDAKLQRPNGIFIDDANLMVTTSQGGELLRISKDNKDIEILTDEIGAGDGIVPVGNGNYIVSSWSGQVFLIDENSNKQTLLNTEPDKINSADIEYIKENKMLLVPTFNDNRVVAYRLLSPES